MSKTRWWTTTASVPVFLLSAGSVTAQEMRAAIEETAAALEARVERLRPVVEELRLEKHAVSAAREEARRRDAAAHVGTVQLQLGLVRIVARADQEDLAREVFGEVWADHFSDIRESAALQNVTFSFQWGDAETPLPHGERTTHRIEPSRWVTRAGLSGRVREDVAAILARDLTEPGSEVGAWVNGSPLREHDLEDSYRHLATTPSKSTRDCLVGDVASCAAALGLAMAGDKLEAWYTPVERRAMVVERFSFARSVGRRYQAPYRSCAVAGVQEACDALLRGTGSWAPLPGSVRASLVSRALAEGGAGAWHRLLEDRSMTPEQALEYASGLGLLELVELWRTEVIDRRPRAQARLGLGTALAMAWTLFFAGFAMRSTRWRLA